MKNIAAITLALVLVPAQLVNAQTLERPQVPLSASTNTNHTPASLAKTERSLPYAPKSARVEIRPEGPSAAELAAPTQVVVLGTGTPIPDAYRAGSSIAVIHRGEAFVFDIGAGAVRRAVEARYKYDIPSLYPSQIKAVFITHMHSDHVMDLSELAHTLWWRRPAALQAYGPVGLKAMTKSMEAMLAADIATRKSGVQPVPNPIGYQVDATEITPGVVFQSEGISVEAFTVPHGDIKPAFGFKIVTDDLSIVISGDTADSKILREKARGVDLLFHEVISWEGLKKNTPFWQNYHTNSHTLASDAGKIAADARPKTLVLYHGLYYGTQEQGVVEEAAEHFKGKIHLAEDLDIFSAVDR